jgi:hypothetical protein
MSAPAAAGRSPTKPKRTALGPSKKRFAPPIFGITAPSVSISSLLNGTVANKKPRKARTIEESKPKSWFFDIFEEPEQVQSDRMNEWTLSQSASFLDVSDDESKGKEQLDRGKENVDPNEIAAPLTRSMAATKAAADLKKDIMADDRIPLGDLNPSQFYAEGLDATSVVLVHDDTPADEAETVPTRAANPKETSDFTFVAPEMTQPLAEDDSIDIGAVILSSTPSWDIAVDRETVQQDRTNDFPPASGDIEIWESGSAKDENEKLETDSMQGDMCALQEL